MSYSKQDCIDSLREAAAELGGPLKAKDYRGGEYSPSDRTILNKFGTWNEAKRAAGLEVVPHGENEAFIKAAEARGVGCPFHTDDRGYEVWTVWDHPIRRRVLVHRLVAIAEHGVDEVVGKVVHHRNSIPWDNRPENLEVLSRGEHARHHYEAGDVQHIEGRFA